MSADYNIGDEDVAFIIDLVKECGIAYRYDEESIAFYEEWIELIEVTLERYEHRFSTTDFLTICYSISRFFFIKNDRGTSLSWAKKGLKISREKLGDKHIFTTQFAYILSIIYSSEFNKGEEKKYQEILTESLADNGSSSENMLFKFHKAMSLKAEYETSLHNLSDRKNKEKNEALLDQIIDDLSSLLTICDEKDSGVKASILTVLANAYQHKGKFKELLKLRKELLAITKADYGEKSHFYADALENLANDYASLKQLWKTAVLYERSLAIRNEITTEDLNLDVAITLRCLGSIYCDLKAYEKCEEYFVRSIESYEKILGSDNAHLVLAWSSFAAYYADIGKRVEATTLYRRAAILAKKLNHILASELDMVARSWELAFFEEFFGGTLPSHGVLSAKLKFFVKDKSYPDPASPFYGVLLIHRKLKLLSQKTLDRIPVGIKLFFTAQYLKIENLF